MTTTTTSTAVHKFPTQLHYVLSEVEKDGLSHIVSWHPHGRSFAVHKPDEFFNVVLRRWFRQKKLASFHRQLNIYGFTRITGGPDRNGYYHECFLRGKIQLTYGIPRMYVKGTTARRPNSSRNEPNFYAMPFLTDDASSVSGGGATTPINDGSPTTTTIQISTAVRSNNMVQGDSGVSSLLSMVRNGGADSQLVASTMELPSSGNNFGVDTTASLLRNLHYSPANRNNLFVGPGSLTNASLSGMYSANVSGPIISPSSLRSLSDHELAMALQSISASRMVGGGGGMVNATTLEDYHNRIRDASTATSILSHRARMMQDDRATNSVAQHSHDNNNNDTDRPFRSLSNQALLAALQSTVMGRNNDHRAVIVAGGGTSIPARLILDSLLATSSTAAAASNSTLQQRYQFPN